MRYRGEITVFLSLTILCVMSLMLGLLESARTAGARLYLRMASDSAVSSVMSYYNRNLWDRYQLLFLEYDSEAAIQETSGVILIFIWNRPICIRQDGKRFLSPGYSA